MYEGKNFNEEIDSGKTRKLCLDQDEEGNSQPSEFSIYKDYMDNDAEAIWCGKKVRYQLCTGDLDATCEGYKRTASGAGGVKNRRIGYHLKDKVTSVRLWPYDPLEEAAVTLFSQMCWGYSGVFFGGSALNERISYTQADIEKAGLNANTV